MTVQTQFETVSPLTASLEKFGEELLTRLPLPDNSSQWDNPENIDAGTCGTILLLAYFYERTGDRRYLEAATQLMEEVISFCKQQPSGNFSLYTGRGGVAMTLIRLYRLSEDQRLLTTAINVMTDAKLEYLESPYVSDYLYDGRAGTLLVLLHLYDLTHKKSVLELIKAFAVKIIRNAGFNHRGIYWERSAPDSYAASPSFALGSGGIGYVFAQLSTYFNDPSLSIIQEECRKYEDLCWDENLSGWLDHSIRINDAATFYNYYNHPEDDNLFTETYEYSWKQGIAGIGIARLNNPLPSTEVQLFLDKIWGKLEQFVLGDKIDSGTLADGLAGIGMFLLQAYITDPQERILKVLDKIAHRLLPELGQDLTGGLMHGSLGAAYFCLHYKAPDKESWNILNPRILKKAGGDEQPIGNTVDIYKILLSSMFKRSMPLALHLIPNELNIFLQDTITTIPTVESFIGFLASMADTPPPHYECLMDLLKLEEKKIELARSVKRTLKEHIQEILQYQQLVKTFNEDDWFFNKKVRITGNMHIINTKWDWTTQLIIKRDKFNPVDLINFPPSLFSTMLYISADGRVVERSVILTDSILHIFHHPKTAAEAMKELKIYFTSVTDRARQDNIVIATGSESYDDFLIRSDYLIKHNLQQLIFDNVLKFL